MDLPQAQATRSVSVTNKKHLHPERIINRGRLISAPALAIAWRDIRAVWCQIPIARLVFVSIGGEKQWLYTCKSRLIADAKPSCM